VQPDRRNYVLPVTAARILLLVSVTGAGLHALAPAGSAASFRLQLVVKVAQPVYLTAPAGDRRVFVVSRMGRIWIVRSGRLVRQPFADLRSVVELRDPRHVDRDQGGLLSLAFAPDYANSGLLYVFYTHRDGNIHVDELQASPQNPGIVLPDSRRTLLTVERLTRNDIGGHLQFGPDGLLYIGFGYGSDPWESQDLASLRGKLLRIDPRQQRDAPYGIPEDNPYVRTAGARPEIYASGLRVPWRFSFDRVTGDLVLPDVGEDRYEEANFLRRGSGAGANFGWPVFEGRRRRRSGQLDRPVFPALTRRHGRNVCAIIGGPIVRDRRITALYGRFLYANLCNGGLRSARLRPARARGDRREGYSRFPVSFGEDARARVYVISLIGAVRRVRPP
jgi:glucose/arabinose dehydrogenase